MDDETDTSAIEARFPGWHIWKSDTGRWWAARATTLPAAKSNAGCAQYLQSDSPDGLRDQITADNALSGRLTPAEPPDQNERNQHEYGTTPQADACTP
jgi:hypothetical protein